MESQQRATDSDRCQIRLLLVRPRRKMSTACLKQKGAFLKEDTVFQTQDRHPVAGRSSHHGCGTKKKRHLVSRGRWIREMVSQKTKIECSATSGFKTKKRANMFNPLLFLDVKEVFKGSERVLLNASRLVDAENRGGS
jgi:hypothetical protein